MLFGRIPGREFCAATQACASCHATNSSSTTLFLLLTADQAPATTLTPSSDRARLDRCVRREGAQPERAEVFAQLPDAPRTRRGLDGDRVPVLHMSGKRV
jgi:hypothetical protein